MSTKSSSLEVPSKIEFHAVEVKSRSIENEEIYPLEVMDSRQLFKLERQLARISSSEIQVNIEPKSPSHLRTEASTSLVGPYPIERPRVFARGDIMGT